SRFFAGNEHDECEKRIAEHFNRKNKYYKGVSFNGKTVEFLKLKLAQDERSEFETGPSMFLQRELSEFKNYEEAYHQMMMDIIHLQVLSTDLVLHESNVKKIYVDGGFSNNAIYMNLLAKAYKEYEVYSATVAQASAIGAALALHTGVVPSGIVEVKRQHYEVL
ncbi:MAG TPA: hypothetical protein VM101_06810, partial [Flavitalea sp.]|nr:hypothetical protein [Flavitalea sp.]